MKRWIALASIDIDIPQRTLESWCEHGRIKAKKIGRKWFIDVYDLQDRFGDNIVDLDRFRPQ